jgi:hypothetical protein
MFRSPDSPDYFTVFDRLSNVITDDGEFILECVRRGLLDVLHTYGCFTDRTHFTRQLAETALDALRMRGITIETWVNHGPPTNVQCMGTRDGWQGDAAGSAGYHADLTIDHGVRWVWTGSEVTDRMALDAFQPARASRRGAGRLRSRIRRRMDRQTALVEPYRLRDGQRVRRFWRYSGVGGRTPVLDDLPRQLSRTNLDELVRAAGYAIVYQHLGVRRVRPGFGTGAYASVGASWFTPAELSALRGLAQRHRDGEIWVAPTTQVLRYRDVHSGLRWDARRDRERDIIVIRPSGTAAGLSQPARNDVKDLTFYCERPEATVVYLEGIRGLEVLDDIRQNPADATLQPSVTVLPRPKANPLP